MGSWQRTFDQNNAFERGKEEGRQKQETPKAFWKVYTSPISDGRVVYCSNCHNEFERASKYCPNCGCEMGVK